MPQTKVLFLCTGNSARSQMAEAFLRHYGGGCYAAYSAGILPKGLHPLTVQVMAEAGLDVSQQRSKSLEEYVGRERFDYLITVCSQAEESCPYFPGQGVRLHWPFEDPAVPQDSPEQSLERFRRIRDGIEARILAWLREREEPGENPIR